MMAATTLTSSDAAAMDDRRNLELLLMMMMMVIHSLLRKEGDDDDADELKDMVREFIMSINGGDRAAVSKELYLAVSQRLLDSHLRLLDGGEKGQAVVVVSSSASDHQLMDSAAAAKKKEKAAAAGKKKKRNKRNKAAAKHKGTKRMSWLGGGIISLLMMAAFGSIMTPSLIPHSDGSSEGKAPPTLPPSPSTSLRRRVQSSNNVAPELPSSVDPFAAVVQAPIFSPDTVNNRRMNSVETASLSPTSSMCIDKEGWYDAWGYDCSWYEVMDVPGCPQYGDLCSEYSECTSGVAKDNCCYCKNDVVSTLSPTVAPSLSGTCVDTQGWKDLNGEECEWYRKNADPGCPKYRGFYATLRNHYPNMGPASEHCCYCKDPTCEDYKWKCQDYTTKNYWTGNPDNVKSVKSMCDKASSCYECETADHVKIVTNLRGSFNETVGLYNECMCDFWLHLCEDTRQGDACDFAAEYCCGDYRYYQGEDASFWYLNSPVCYCDFFNYAQNEFGHKLKPKALNINTGFSNPCGRFNWASRTEDEKETDCVGRFEDSWDYRDEKGSLEAIYEGANGQNWTRSDGWMKVRDHCQWYGISCDDEGFVTSIDLSDNNLVGQFPVYTSNESTPINSEGSIKPILDNEWIWSKYGLAKLYKLKTLDMSKNKLTGTITYGPLYNLHSLTHFDVSGNQLIGEVEALVGPSLTHADFSNNNFTSMRRFQKYKVSPLQTLRYCDVSGNAIQEDAADLLENIPPNIEQFIASKNNITGSLPESLNNLRNLRQFNMESNAVSGKLPGFTESFVTLQELDVSNQDQSNGFSGSIPENIWRSLSLKILNMAGNRLTGTIPSLVGNLAVLEVFDLSNNLLGSSLPPELGMLEGSLKRLGLSNNNFTGIIPSEIGQLQRASVFLEYNHFDSYAPLSLCVESKVKMFDLANDTTLCPPERNALSSFYDSAKGAEWTDQGRKTDGSLWLDEYASYCDWKGVDACNDDGHVTELNLSNNGLSGRLSESIGKLTFIEKIDLSDNDIKGSIPAEIGLLENLKYLRLSYNAFTGTAPKELGELTKLQLLHLQSNRITNMSSIPQLDNSIHGKSTFVTDCGVPSSFDEALKCEHCTMCCNTNDDCYPQEKTRVAEWGLKDYSTFAALVFGCFIMFCCISALLFYEYDRYKTRGITLTMAMETRIKADDERALSKIGKDSVYSYFVTGTVYGWLTAFATVGIQIGILVVFILASEPELHNDKSDIQFTWKCPRDTDKCDNKSDLENRIWAIFCVLMVAFLAKDMISGSKLIYHSAKVRHSLSLRIRYFFGGTCLCWITLFALYVSAVYNKAIATSNTQLILNSVVVLFIMDMDEYIFAALEAANEKWTAGSEDTNSDTKTRSGSIITEMKDEIALQREQIASQQEQITSQQEDLLKLRELVEKLQESQAAAAAAAAATTTTNASDSESVSEYEDDTNARQMEQSDEITMPCGGEQNTQEPQVALLLYSTLAVRVMRRKICNNKFDKRYSCLLLIDSVAPACPLGSQSTGEGS